MIFALIILVSVAFGIIADIKFFKGVAAGHSHNKWSWFIWFFGSVVEVLTYAQVTDDYTKIIAFSFTPIACLVLLMRVWKHGSNKWESKLEAGIDIASVAISIAAILTWLVFQEEVWAHVLMVVAVPISYIPTWYSIHDKKIEGEHVPWMLWTFMDAVNLVIVITRLDNYAELPYGLVELICHASVWLIISMKMRKMHR